MKTARRISPDMVIVAILLLAAALSALGLGSLVAQPKTLFGRSMTAISPTLFPSIVLWFLVILCVLFLIQRIGNATAAAADDYSLRGWRAGLVFFALLTFYALTMVPLGFLVSTALTLAALSILVGNRSLIQIVILSLAAPVLLYLAATRLLAVSLPELDMLEFFYARLLS